MGRLISVESLWLCVWYLRGLHLLATGLILLLGTLKMVNGCVEGTLVSHLS